MTSTFRFPAEWEPQSAILLAWPHAGTDWAERLDQVEDTYIALVAAIARFEQVLVCVADDDIEAYARARLSSARIDMARVAFATVAYDDTWLRDSGPITLVAEGADEGSFKLLDFRFTAWGGSSKPARTTAWSSACTQLETSSRVIAKQLILHWKAVRSRPTARAPC